MGGHWHRVLAVGLLAPGLALAQPAASDSPQAALERGNARYQEQRFAEAAREFQAAYDQTHHAALLYNLARALEAAGDPRGALDAYRRFDEAGAPGADPAALQSLRERIAGLRERLGEQPAPPERPRVAAPSRLGPLLFLGGGVACVGASVAFGLLSAGNTARVAEANRGAEPYSAALESARQGAGTQSVLAWSLGLGGASLVLGSVVWFMLQARPGRATQSPQAALTPGLMPTPGGLVLSFGAPL
jgi:tetratricopeptide (TPR) repeat protein